METIAKGQDGQDIRELVLLIDVIVLVFMLPPRLKPSFRKFEQQEVCVEVRASCTSPVLLCRWQVLQSSSLTCAAPKTPLAIMPRLDDDTRQALLHDAEEARTRVRRFWDGFTDFALRDNVLEVAVGLMFVPVFSPLGNHNTSCPRRPNGLTCNAS